MNEPPFLCPRCAFTSHHPKDASERYCAHCHAFVDDPTFREPAKRTILVVVAHPGQGARTLRIAGDLESIQTIVGGNIEMLAFEMLSTETATVGLHLYVNEDGKALSLAPNLRFPPVVAAHYFDPRPLRTLTPDDAAALIANMDTILGPMVVSGLKGNGDEVGLTEEQAVAAAQALNRLRGIVR